MELSIFAIILLLALLIIILLIKIRPALEPQYKVPLQIIINKTKLKGIFTMLSMKYDYKADVTLQPQDALGNPAPIQPGSLVVSTTDPNVAQAELNSELGFTVFGKNPGVCQLDFRADADLGEGVVEISGFLGVEITPEMAVGFGVTIGEPVPQN